GRLARSPCDPAMSKSEGVKPENAKPAMLAQGGVYRLPVVRAREIAPSWKLKNPATCKRHGVLRSPGCEALPRVPYGGSLSSATFPRSDAGKGERVR
ncbi:MAG: hypothetical protein ACKO0Z_06285, partial [Betaproteobacteria bacterium]